jgi:hypothetical protein
MWHTFELQIPDTTGGIAVNLTAWSVYLPEAPIGPLRAGPRTWLEVSQVRLTGPDIDQLLSGLAAVAPVIEAARPDHHVLIDVVDVQYRTSSSQPGIMAAAIMGWAAEEFDFTWSATA